MKEAETNTKYPGVTYKMFRPENPSQYDSFVSDRPYKERAERYLWFASDPRFNATFAGGYMLHDGYCRTVRPGEENPEGWNFSLRIYNALKKIEGLDFSVQPPNDEGLIILYIKPVWLNAAIQKLCGLELGPYQNYYIEIPSAWRKKRGFVQALAKNVSCIWSAHQERAERWETLAHIAKNISHPDVADSLAGYKKHKIPDHPEVSVFQYSDGSVRVTGTPAWDQQLDYVIPASKQGLKQSLAEIKSYLDERDDYHYG